MVLFIVVDTASSDKSQKTVSSEILETIMDIKMCISFNLTVIFKVKSSNHSLDTRRGVHRMKTKKLV